MLSDSQVMKLSMAVSVLGLIMLFIVTQNAEPKAVSMNEITDSMVGQNIKTSGFVKSVSVKDGTVFIAFNASEIRLVMFEKDAKNSGAYEIKAGDNVTAEGTLNFYKGDMEIVARKIYKQQIPS